MMSNGELSCISTVISGVILNDKDNANKKNLPTDCLLSTSPKNRHLDMRPSKRAKMWAGEEDEGYKPTRGLYTFAPPKEIFENFDNFVRDIAAVGR